MYECIFMFMFIKVMGDLYAWECDLEVKNGILKNDCKRIKKKLMRTQIFCTGTSVIIT